ncbi:glycosyltransferase family 2 protein [Brevundimonas sp.]|uniref:glycosyltransferase family 2 protein n=1 Tax=Brevundimonas sp. TaxID=1871086 RepID=UPI0025FF680B|nr:glycosyltransferase family 2 protein [Brevundimonas sp.]
MTPQTLAMALELQGRSEIATLALTMAAMRDQQNEGLALAAGPLMQRHGHLQAAERLFTRCNRAYEDGCRNFIWPRSETGGWPRGGGPSAAAFDALLPESAQWPRITVVTPSYNQADFVEETVLSVLNQHYPNLQYIIVDGGSTDGAAEILERYRDKVDVLIIEPDKGQTDAINKGFALADGELMTWLNSDDMFAPGALHRIALEYLNSKADIIAGICVAYRDGRVEVANLPAVRQETFTVEVMADIFRYWMKGYFFYQPEVVFSRAIWEKTGGRLNDDLNFTMDYEFWMRCAQAGARFEVVHWPVALFRQHEAQKTSRLLHCVDEQAVVRDEIKQIAPSDDRSRSLVTGARERLRAEPIKVAVYTSRFDKIFSPLVEAELAHRFKDTGMSVRLFASAEDLPVDDDFIVWLVHLQNDDYAIDAYRQRGGRAQIIGWFWDNHHHLFPNRDVVERLDYWSAGHAFVSNYLANDQALKLEPTPLSVTQWARQEAEIFYREVGDQPRSDVLYGGFVRYAFAEKRNTLIQALMDEGEEGVYFLEEADARRYFDRSRRSRFAEWAAHKTSLCLPLDGDLSQRLFDALLTGQVPIAPKDIADLDAVIPPALQKKLPIVRFDKYKPGDVKAAHAKALKLFDEGGAEGAMVRHRIALESHMFSDRIAALLDKVRALADGR